jgi:hypothetical protein
VEPERPPDGLRSVVPRLKRGAGWAVKLALTLAVTYFLFRSLRLSWSEIASLEPKDWWPRPIPLAASFALLLSVFGYLVSLWARMVSSLGGPRLRLGEAFRIFFVANLGRYVPGKVWQLAGLTYLAGKRGVSIPVASSAAILGQVYSLGAAACVAAVALALGPMTGLPRGLLPGALALAAVVVVLTTVPPVLRHMLLLCFRLGKSAEPPPEVDSLFGARWLALYVPGWLGYGLAFGLLWESVPALADVSWGGAIGGFAGAYFLGYAALFAPAGVGVREGALSVWLAPWLGGAAAAGLAVMARLWMTVGEIIPVTWIAIRQGFSRPGGSTERDHA